MSTTSGHAPRFPRPLLVAVAAVLVLSLTGAGAFALRSAQGAQQIVIGALAVDEGPLADAGQDAFRGLDLAVAEFGDEIAGKEIVVLEEGTDGTAEQAIEKIKKLIELDGADFVIGPLTGAEGLRIKEFARTVPDRTFINGASGAQDLTLRNPAPNVFRFNPDSAQWQAGLGLYAYHDLGYRRVAVVATDASFPYAQVGGFMTEFCNAGGHVIHKIWVPAGTVDFAETIAEIPEGVDAVYVALEGADAAAFVTAYAETGSAVPIVAGTETLSPTLLSATGPVRDLVLTAPSAGPIAADYEDPAWEKFVADYQRAYPDGPATPSVYAHQYYTSTKAALLALDQVDADLGDGQGRFQEALAGLTFYTPTGPVRLDHNRQAIVNVFVTVVDVDTNGVLYNKIVRVVPNVNQTLGFPETKFLAQGQFGRDNPACP